MVVGSKSCGTTASFPGLHSDHVSRTIVHTRRTVNPPLNQPCLPSENLDVLYVVLAISVLGMDESGAGYLCAI